MSDDQGKPFTPTADTLPKTDGSGKEQRRLVRNATNQSLTPELESTVKVAGTNAQQQYPEELRDPAVARHVAKIYLACLLPKQPKGRKPIAAGSQAICMFKSKDLKHVEARKRWAKIYPKVIINCYELTPGERAERSARLRNQAQSRLRSRKRRGKGSDT